MDAPLIRSVTDGDRAAVTAGRPSVMSASATPGSTPGARSSTYFSSVR
nr:hypothetical protein [Nocardioides sp.]